MTGPAATAGSLAAVVLAELSRRGATLATAESLTGGLLAAALTAVPGASVAYRGGVVAYATDLKTALLDVDAGLLARKGPVSRDVARAMAAGVARRLGADYGLATTGVAGPDPQGGSPVGTVHVAAVAAAAASGERVGDLLLPGDRAAVRAAAVQAVLGLAAELLHAADPGSPATGSRRPGRPGRPGRGDP